MDKGTILNLVFIVLVVWFAYTRFKPAKGLRNLNAQAFQTELATRGTVIDVREPNEYKSGFIAGAKNILKDPHLKKVNKEFYEYFNGLTHDDTAIILSIMYIGRDEKDPDEYERRRQEFEVEGYEFDEPEDGVFDSPQKKVFDYLRYIKMSKTSKDEIISIMMEKSDLPEYLLDGLQILRVYLTKKY